MVPKTRRREAGAYRQILIFLHAAHGIYRALTYFEQVHARSQAGRQAQLIIGGKGCWSQHHPAGEVAQGTVAAPAWGSTIKKRFEAGLGETTRPGFALLDNVAVTVLQPAFKIVSVARVMVGNSTMPGT